MKRDAPAVSKKLREVIVLFHEHHKNTDGSLIYLFGYYDALSDYRQDDTWNNTVDYNLGYDDGKGDLEILSDRTPN